MSKLFEELDYCPTPIGALSLRRRRELSLGVDIVEVKLGDEHLMSSLFVASEVALGRRGVAAAGGGGLDVVVGGLGLGYTAQAVLESQAVDSLLVVEMLEPVIDWHQKGLLPIGKAIADDARCHIVHDDFFALAASGAGFDAGSPRRRFGAILVDIDHTPDALLDERSRSFYRPEGLRALAGHLTPGGVFGLWSNDLPDEVFTERLLEVFAKAWAETVSFHNPIQDRSFTQTIYLARTAFDPAEAQASANWA